MYLGLNNPVVMGILNITPDSFSDGGRYTQNAKAVERAYQMVDQGAQIIDIGGESTRPGAEPVTVEEELQRVIPVIKELAEHSTAAISIDTYKSEVAVAALQAGAHIINDISGCSFDPAMAEVAGRWNCPIVIMHIKGQPNNMQLNPVYDNVVQEVYNYLQQKIEWLYSLGVEKIIIDPGIGFGKRFEDNLVLLRDLKQFSGLGKPILIGTSRKSFLGKILSNETHDRLSGSIASNIAARANGASIFRVHDVKETVEALQVVQRIQQGH